MSPPVQSCRRGEGHNGLRIDVLEGGRYLGIPQNMVNEGYDALPLLSGLKFNKRRDIPEATQ